MAEPLGSFLLLQDGHHKGADTVPQQIKGFEQGKREPLLPTRSIRLRHKAPLSRLRVHAVTAIRWW